jgi:hypothetical protein
VDWNGESVMVTDLDSKNGTWDGDKRLESRVVQPWEWDQTLKLGYYSVRLEQEHPTPRLGVVVQERTLALTPGVPAVTTVTLANLGYTVDHLTVSVEGRGIEESWWTGPSEEVQLNPGTRQEVQVTVTVPRTSKARAGEYVVQVHQVDDGVGVHRCLPAG